MIEVVGLVVVAVAAFAAGCRVGMSRERRSAMHFPETITAADAWGEVTISWGDWVSS